MVRNIGEPLGGCGSMIDKPHKKILRLTFKECVCFRDYLDIQDYIFELLDDYIIHGNYPSCTSGGKKNIISISPVDNDINMTEVFSKLKRLSERFEVTILGDGQECITPISFDKKILTEDMKNFLSANHGIVKTIVMTSVSRPEEYDCLDKFGNKIAYMRLLHGLFSVQCPDSDSNNCVYENWEDITGDGSFSSDHERITQFSCALEFINYYYSHVVRRIRRYVVNPGKDDETCCYEKIDSKYSDEEMIKTLYNYQISNFTPEEVIHIRHKGPTIGYEESIKRVLKNHRKLRHNMFPEENGERGLNSEHIEQEIEFFKTNTDELVGMINTINWLFHKEFEDFEAIFREYAVRGTSSL